MSDSLTVQDQHVVVGYYTGSFVMYRNIGVVDFALVSFV